MKSTKAEDVVHMLITIGVGAIGGAVGFKHSHDWAVANGQEDWIAWAVAVVIECMVIVAGLELKRRVKAFPVMVLVGAFLMQMAAQVASAPKTVAGWLIAATPALAFLVIVKMLLGRLMERQRQPAAVPVHQVPPAEPLVATTVAATAERADHQLPAEHGVREIAPAPAPEPSVSTPTPVPDQSPVPVPTHPVAASWPPGS